MWNEICPHSRQRIFHICGANISQRSYFTCPKGKFRWKKHACACFFLAGIVGLEPTKCKSQSLVPSPTWLYPIIKFFEKSLESVYFQGFLCQHWAIVPARLQASIVATAKLNFCVRNGNRWTLCVWNTDFEAGIDPASFDPFGSSAFADGAPSGIRTRDPLIKSQLLYQLS